MRYLRMLTNAVLGGTLVAAYVTVLVLQLNPHLSLHPLNLAPLAATFWLFYGAHMSVIFYALILVRQLVATEPMSPGWLSLRLLAWLSAAAAMAASALMWLNLRGLQLALEGDAARRMAVGATAMSVCALALLAIAVVHYSFGRQGSRVGGALFTLAITASVALPLVARGPGVTRPLESYRLDVGSWMASGDGTPHVVVMLLDGASLEYISPAAAEGRLPSFGTILDSGASMHLATLRPTQPGPVWTAVATGKYSPKHGVPSSSTYHVAAGRQPIELLPNRTFTQGLVRLGFLREAPNTAVSVRARPLWNILSGLGVSVGVVGLPLTYPAQPVLGYLVSDRLHLLTDSPIDATAPDVAYPREVLPVVRQAAVFAGRSRVRLDSTLNPSEEAELFDALVDAVPLPRDQLYASVAATLQKRFDAQFMVMRYQGLDIIGHRFLRYATPRAFGDVSEAEAEQYGHVLEQYYGFIDARVGEVMGGLGPGDLLLIVSGFGMEPVDLGTRLLARVMGDPDLTGTHEWAPDGFMLAFGSPVEPGRVSRGSVVDVAPTILYFLGLPVGRDVDGYARTDLFTPAFTSERPITFIPTYDR